MSSEDLMKLAAQITSAKLQSSNVPATPETGTSTAAFLEEVYYELVMINNNLEKRPIK